MAGGLRLRPGNYMAHLQQLGYSFLPCLREPGNVELWIRNFFFQAPDLGGPSSPLKGLSSTVFYCTVNGKVIWGRSKIQKQLGEAKCWIKTIVRKERGTIPKG